MKTFKLTPEGDSGETLVDRWGVLRGRDSSGTVVEEACRDRCVLPSRLRPGSRQMKQKAGRLLPDNLYAYNKDGLVIESKYVDRVVKLYVRKRPDWGIKDALPALTLKERVAKLFTPTRVWKADMVQRTILWNLQWQTEIVQQDQAHGNVLAIEAIQEGVIERQRAELELCDRWEAHDARLRYIMEVEAPKFWANLGL